MTETTFADFLPGFEAEYPDTDLYAYYGPIRRPYDDELIGEFEGRSKRKNLILMLTTYGGDPDAAYRIARSLQRSYGLLPKRNGDQNRGSFSVFVDSACASAGTLIALGGTRVIMSEYAELSPLDIQIRKPDDVWERDSGLTPTQALDILERRSKSLFKEHFNQLRLDSELGLTTKTSVDVASKITTGLLAPIYEQLDPMRLGEVERLMGIIAAYGERLGVYNLKDGALAKLLARYPSHSFVIDRFEARELFENVSVPQSSLKAMGEYHRKLAQSMLSYRRPFNLFLNKPPEPPAPAAPPSPPAGPNQAREPRHDEEAAGGDGAGAQGTRPRRRAPRRGGEAALQ
jgi:hypothetical protein